MVEEFQLRLGESLRMGEKWFVKIMPRASHGTGTRAKEQEAWDEAGPACKWQVRECHACQAEDLPCPQHAQTPFPHSQSPLKIFTTLTFSCYFSCKRQIGKSNSVPGSC